MHKCLFLISFPFVGRAGRILVPSLLSNEPIYLELQTPDVLYEAIATLRVRGAPAIGIFAGYALYVLALQTKATSYADFLAECQKSRDYLNSSRHTAVNLRHMLDRVLAVVQSMPCADISAFRTPWGKWPRPSTRRTSPCVPPSPSMACPW